MRLTAPITRHFATVTAVGAPPRQLHYRKAGNGIRTSGDLLNPSALPSVPTTSSEPTRKASRKPPLRSPAVSPDTAPGAA
ncbi:MAG: hypothetical protein CK529_06980 [Rhodospirillaceae bacterium]|nr:MAG: hypothetical protein CK529_06980 [Rhodospirillaceae bacterium]